MENRDKEEFRKLCVQLSESKFHTKNTALIEVYEFIKAFDRGRE